MKTKKKTQKKHKHNVCCETYGSIPSRIFHPVRQKQMKNLALYLTCTMPLPHHSDAETSLRVLTNDRSEKGSLTRIGQAVGRVHRSESGSQSVSQSVSQ